MKPVATWGTNWTNSAGRAATDYQAGVTNYNGDWAGATVRQQAVMQANFIASMPTWAARVQAVGTTGWKDATIRKIANYSTGFQAGSGNYNIAAGKIGAALTNILPSLPPRGNYTENKLRATTLMDSLHALKGQLGAK